MKDIMEEMTPDVLHASSLYQLITKHKPDIIVDSINSATGIAYQDLYSSYHKITKTLASNPSLEAVIEETEKLICTQYVPQLIRHIQLLYS